MAGHRAHATAIGHLMTIGIVAQEMGGGLAIIGMDDVTRHAFEVQDLEVFIAVGDDVESALAAIARGPGEPKLPKDRAPERSGPPDLTAVLEGKGTVDLSSLSWWKDRPGGELFADAGAPKGGLLRTEAMGEVVLPTGKLVVCDPLATSDWLPLDLEIAPGRYPTFLAIASFEREERAAYAWIRLGSGTPAAWSVARTVSNGGSLARGNFTLASRAPHFSVDSGAAAFMDRAVYRQLHTAGVIAKLKISSPPKWIARIAKELDTTSHGAPTWKWIDLRVDGAANVVAFYSGWGHGMYRPYAGRDEKGELVAVVVDLNLAKETIEGVI